MAVTRRGEEEGTVVRTSSPTEMAVIRVSGKKAATLRPTQVAAVALEEPIARSWLLGTLMMTRILVLARAFRMSGSAS